MEDIRKPDDTEELATVVPLSKKDKTWIVIIAVIVLLLAVGAFFAIRFGIFVKKIAEAGSLIQNTLETQSAAFTANVTYGDRTASLKGTLCYTKERTSGKCVIDYGNRAVTLLCDTQGDSAYLRIESETETKYIDVDISGVRRILGETDGDIYWKKVLESMSTDKVKLLEYYNPEKIDEAIEAVKSRLKSPFALNKAFDCRSKDGKYTLTTDMYKLMTFFTEPTKNIFVSEQSYKNLMKIIEDERKALSAQTVTVVLEGDGKMLDSMDITIKEEKILHIVISLSKCGSTEPQAEFTADPEKSSTVTAFSAYRTILRAGLDTEGARKEANMCLNAFAERFRYNFKAGTIVIMYDADENDFRFVYNKNNILEQVDEDDELYTSWTTDGYVQLDTQNIDAGKYRIEIFEPGNVKNEAADYNEAYLSALNAVYVITSAHYEIPENAVFLVKVNGTDFQFRYESGNLYDVYEQYYYIIYTEYSAANLTAFEGIPTNTVLYLPKQESVPQSGETSVD